MKEQIERICISVNTECNLGCKYCYFFNPGNRVTKEKPLSVDEIFEILKKIDEYSKKEYIKKVIKVNFVGSGEPLLHWDNIKQSIEKFNKIKSNNKVEFYLVTNGTLLTDKIAKEMKEINIFPSVSLDGYEELHNENRLTHNQKGSFKDTMQGIQHLRNNNFKIAVNTTTTKSLIKNIEKFFKFLSEQKIDKVIFDRLVDTPSNFENMDYKEFYDFLLKAYQVNKDLNLNIEIGNIEAYKKNFKGIPDKVCTMFGASCGAGTNFLIYMSREVYPCGRMFGQEKWKLGNYKDDIEKLQSNMYPKLIEKEECKECVLAKDCIRDCLLEYEDKNYNCDYRKEFLVELKNRLYNEL